MNAQGTTAARRNTPARVLVVDDEEDVRNLVAFNLRAAGLEPVMAADGTQAINQVRREKPDLVILDLMLPELDGISVCEMIRKLPDAADVPVIMLTAWATERARLVGLQAGANEYLTKPFSPRELVRRVQALLAERQLRETAGPTLTVKKLCIDLENRSVQVDGRLVELQADEFRMLTLVFQALLKRLPPAGAAATDDDQN